MDEHGHDFELDHEIFEDFALGFGSSRIVTYVRLR